MSKEYLFKITFIQDKERYEVYARQVSESDMYGFIVVEELVFGERSQVVVDPVDERLKNEFLNVVRTYIPIQSVLRIDEVEREGVAKIVKPTGMSNISQFPGTAIQKAKD